jgi:hypothetical protein
MEDIIFLGRGDKLLPASQVTWKQHLAHIPQQSPGRLDFMTDAHHLVRNFVVVELAHVQEPIEPKLIAEALMLPLDQVVYILEELETKRFFLVRNEHGAVSWAYPVTVERTPHKLRFDTGEQLYAA